MKKQLRSGVLAVAIAALAGLPATAAGQAVACGRSWSILPTKMVRSTRSSSPAVSLPGRWQRGSQSVGKAITAGPAPWCRYSKELR
jgi:hypothetical protein